MKKIIINPIAKVIDEDIDFMLSYVNDYFKV